MHMDRSKKAFAGANAPTGTPKDQWARTRLSLAVSAAVATAASVAAQEVEQAQNTGRLETVVVTATKRVESAQDVSIALQAVTGDTLREIGAETFDEYVEYLPNVVAAGNGPGKKEIYIRGSATEQTSVTISSAQGSAPGVALYVDEQPVSFGGRNLDVFAADLERIEVLAGPQGTLFGASSQSGNLRLITRKPDPTGFSSGFKARYSATSGGADSSGADAYANLPLGDSLAARIVVYSDNQGGWVDNIPATFTPSAEVVDRNAVGYGPVLTGAETVHSARNDALVQDDWNDASYRGTRIGLSYDISNNWEALVQHTAQTLESEGSFVVDTSLDQPHASARFAPEYNRDEFGLTTWTLTGRLGALDAIYTGGHLSREVDAVIDYTHYNNGGGYITYYLCSGAYGEPADTCYDPTKQYTEDTANVRTTHEFRITTDPVKKLHGIAGVYLNSRGIHAHRRLRLRRHQRRLQRPDRQSPPARQHDVADRGRQCRGAAAGLDHVLQRLHAPCGRAGVLRGDRPRRFEYAGRLLERAPLRADIPTHRRLELLLRLPLRHRRERPAHGRRPLQRHGLQQRRNAAPAHPRHVRR